MQQKPDEAMEVCARGEEEAEAPKAVGAGSGPGLGFWAAARRRLAPDDPFFAAGDMERELLAKHVRRLPCPFPSPPLLLRSGVVSWNVSLGC